MRKFSLNNYGCELKWTKPDDKITYLIKYEDFSVEHIKNKEVIKYIDNKGFNNLKEKDIIFIFEKLNIKSVKPFHILLEKKNVSGSELSRATGIPQQTVSTWVSGKNNVRNASFQYMKLTADALNMSLDELWKELDK